MPRRECLGWDQPCRRLIASGSRCGDCQRQREASRGTTTERGLGAEHQRIAADLLKDNPLCHWCGTAPATTADHLVARARGGRSERDNYVPACAQCNGSRGARGGTPRSRRRRSPS